MNPTDLLEALRHSVDPNRAARPPTLRRVVRQPGPVPGRREPQPVDDIERLAVPARRPTSMSR